MINVQRSAVRGAPGGREGGREGGKGGKKIVGLRSDTFSKVWGRKAEKAMTKM